MTGFREAGQDARALWHHGNFLASWVTISCWRNFSYNCRVENKKPMH